MNYEWDEAKRLANVKHHGVDFSAMAAFEWEKAFLFEDRRKTYDESRYVAYAPIRGRVHCVVFTVRAENLRLISLRKANQRETGRYEEKIRNRPSDG